MGLLTGVYVEWLYLREVFDKTPVVGPDLLSDAEIFNWPARFIVQSDDLLFEIAEGYGDQAQQDLQITVCSSGYSRFLYDNRHDWPSGELRLPWIHVWLRGRGGRSVLATSRLLHGARFEGAGRAGAGFPGPRYALPYAGEALADENYSRRRGTDPDLSCWPTQFLTRSWHYLHSSPEAWDAFNQIKQRTPLLRPKLRLPYRELQALAVL
jgi:hypothetical protein